MGPTSQQPVQKSKKTEFFKMDRAHGYAKRVILKKYLQSWIPRMFFTDTRRPKTISYVDGFSGSGKYSKAKQELEKPIEAYGSPVIAMTAMLDWCNTFKNKEEKSSKRCKMKMVLIEKSKKNFISLRNAMEERQFMYQMEESPTQVFYQNCEFVDADFSEVISPCFGFMDPFGFTHTPMSKVQEFIGEGKELLLNLMVAHINRFGKMEKLIPKVKKLFNDNSKYLQILKLEDAEQKAEQLASLYEEELKSCGAKFTALFCVEGKNVAHLRYYLIFATTSPRSLACMKECMNRVTQEQDKFKFCDKMGQLFDWKNDQDSEGAVKELIYSEFKGRSNVPIDSIKQFVVRELPYYIFRKKSLKALENDGRIIRVKLTDGKKRKKLTFPDSVALITFRHDDGIGTIQHALKMCSGTKRKIIPAETQEIALSENKFKNNLRIPEVEVKMPKRVKLELNQSELLSSLLRTYNKHLCGLTFTGRIDTYNQSHNKRTIVIIEDPNMKTAIANVLSEATHVDGQLNAIGVNKKIWTGITNCYGVCKIWVQEPIHPQSHNPDGSMTFRIQGHIRMWPATKYAAGFEIRI